MVQLNKLIKQEPVFPDTNQVLKEEMYKKNLKITALSLRAGSKGEYFMIKAECEDQQVSFNCGGKVVVEKLKKVVKELEAETLIEDGVIVLPEPVEAMLISTKSKEGKQYDDLQ